MFACAETPEEREAKYVSKGDAKMKQAIRELKDADDEWIAFDSKAAIKSSYKALD